MVATKKEKKKKKERKKDQRLLSEMGEFGASVSESMY